MKDPTKGIINDIISNTSLFRITLFISLFLCGILFLDIVSVVLDVILFFWSIFIFKDRININILKIKYSKLLILFILLFILTATLNIFINFPLNFLINLGMIYYTCVCFFIFYGMYIESTSKKIFSEMILLFKIIVVLTTIFTIIGFIFVIFVNKMEVSFKMPIIGEYERFVGIWSKDDYSARFTGIYTNPNILAFSSVVSIIFSHVLYRTNNFMKDMRKWIQILSLCLITMINLGALILSDSIASFLFLIIYSVIWLFFRILFEDFNFSKFALAKRIAVFLLIGIFLIFSLFFIRSNFQEGASDIMSDIYSLFDNKDSDGDFDGGISFGRHNYNIKDGSGRRKLLNQAIVYFKNRPILGIGPSNVVYYGDIYFSSGVAFPNFHNGYVSILVSNGLAGFVVFMIYLLGMFIMFFKFILSKNKKIFNKCFSILFAAIIAYSVFALFEKTILSEVNYMSLFLWLVLGYTTTIVYNSNKESFAITRNKK